MNSRVNDIFKDASKNFKIIKNTYKILEKTHELKIPTHSAGQWILDNMYIIEQEYEDIKDAKKGLRDIKLPVIKDDKDEKHVSIYYLAYELIENNKGYVDQNIILNCLKEHQKLSYLKSEELDLFVLMLKIAILKFVARVAINISNSQLKKIEVEEIIENDLDDKNTIINLYNDIKSTKNFRDYIQDLSKIKSTNTAFIEYMSYRLKELGPKGNKYFEILNNEAGKIGITIDEAIVKEHMEIAKTTDYMGRAILAYKQIQGLNFREIFEKVNKIDETLMDDYTKEFKKCDYKTKGRYRKYIIKLAKKYDISEVYVAKKAVECSKKYKKHVGFFLVGEQKFLLKKAIGKAYVVEKLYYNVIKPIFPALYMLFIFLATFILTAFITKYFIDFENQFYQWAFVLITFTFTLEIMIKITDFLLRKNVTPRVLPRFDFAKTIDPKYPTYVVMPTMISSIEKVDAMISKMEVTYLANRSENMYYILLGDCVSSDKAVIDIDEKILKYAKRKLDELNEKYVFEHKLFNFLYRKRVFSKGENCYMGWERKRGAIAQFNRLVLGRMSLEEKNKAFHVIYDDIINAKYAITVDEDTELSLNTAKDLVAIISHPLNQPILSKDKKRVVKGYGLIQPSIGIDIEDANKSIFSKIFGGFGGLDIYTNAVSNIYQDCFEEAIFTGKGIYNIELFENLLKDEIPENLVLSHDLLEGSFLKAGLASDIELQDGFPKNYISYMKRNQRWFRGDMQIVKWLVSPKSKISILSKWKIFDNLRRPFLNVIALFALILAIFLSSESFLKMTLVVFFSVNISYFITMLDKMLFGTIRYTKETQYIPIIYGLKADLLTMCFNFVMIPCRAYLCLDSFIKSLYRMIISKKNLLQWTTGEMLDKMSKDTISYYYLNIMVNVIFGLFVIFFDFFNRGIMYGPFEYKCFIGIAFIAGPLFAYLLGKDHLIGIKSRLTDKQNEEIIDVAKRTWNFFDTMMNDINNYLPTDNFQENRRYKIAGRTSSTNIGFGVLAIVNASDLGFITKEEAIKKIKNVYNTIDKLQKWNGHLYNWYNIKTLEPLRPRFVSTVDSGNFISCLYVLKQFLVEIKNERQFIDVEKKLGTDEIVNLIELTEKFIKETDFTKLYDTSRNLFSIGYEQEKGELVDSYYDMLMSESRTTSLIAIARREVTSKHWFALARNLVKVDGYKGLMSWSGTAFEYYMPYIFNKAYSHTLIDQSLFFTKHSQMKYAKKNNVPWGISESAYAIKDDELNYQYKAFGIPWLGLKRGLNDCLVVSPYASILMLESDVEKVYKNIKKLKEIGAYSTYGFYESIDYTKEHLDSSVNAEVIKTYMSHHQGMILSSINNYINHGIIRNRFHNNPDIRACEILLKEREKIKAKIKKKMKDKGNIFKQKDILKYTTHVSSTFAERKYVTPGDASHNLNITFLKGGSLSTMITNKGESYIKYKDKIVNRQRYIDSEGSGNYVLLTDKTTSNVISATNCDIHSSYNKNTKKCVWTSSLNKVDCYIETSDLEVTTNIAIAPEYNMEMKKVSIYNNSNLRKEIIINTYIEPALTDYMTNVVHPSFSNLQIETYYDEALDIIVATKRKKSDDEEDIFVYAKLVGIDLEKDIETEKVRLAKHSDKAYDEKIVQYPLWPVLSYRTSIILDPHERQEFYYLLGVADTKYKMSTAIVNMDKEGIESQFKLTAELNSVVSRYLKLEPTKAEIYNNIIKDVMFKKNVSEDNKYWDENLNQSLLWKYSISGDLPIILVYINKIEDAVIINEVINFMDYVKNRKVDLDIIVLIEEKELERGPIYEYLKRRIDVAVYMGYTKGNIYILNINALTKQEITLLSFLSKRYIQNISELLCVEECIDNPTELLDKKIKQEEGVIDEA